MNLKIEKRQDYIWKSYCWNAYFNLAFATSWYVVDTDTGVVLDGGYHSGGNTQSGHVINPRRKVAKAFLDGFNAFMLDNSIISAERINRTRDDGHEYYNESVLIEGNPFKKTWVADDVLYTTYRDGVVKAARIAGYNIPFEIVTSFNHDNQLTE